MLWFNKLKKATIIDMGFSERQGIRFFQFDSFKDQPIFHAVLTRNGGVSQKSYASLNTGGTVGDDPQAVLRNHHLIYETFGFDFYSRFDVWQVHGTKIICTDKPRERGVLHEKADGILTGNPDVTLFMRFADCVPVLLFDPLKKVIGIIHAGWQGTCQKAVQAAVMKMAACYGSTPGDILAGIGPCICQKCYQVGEEVYDSYINQFGQEADRFFLRENDKLFLDLNEANKTILQESGVSKIEDSGICTACHLEDWYSHRAENGKTGRFGVLMALKVR